MNAAINQRIYRKVINGQEVEAYNDSNSEWVVRSDNNSPQRFPMSKWSMKDAMAFYGFLFEGDK